MSYTAQESQGEMSFIGHLKELRQRLIYCMIALLVIFLGLFYFSNEIYSYLSTPLRSLLPADSQMIATEVTSTFFAPFRLSVFLSFVIAMPYLLFQIWSFIAPGLYEKEKAFVIPVFMLSVVLFYLGMAFAYYLVFPILFDFFTSVGPEDVVPMTDINQYLSFTMKILIAFGLAFEVPIATLFLVKSGVSNVQSLGKKRPYIILGCFVIGMLMTPPDIISQTLLAVPMWILFELGLLLSRWMPTKNKESDKHKEPKSQAESAVQEKSAVAAATQKKTEKRTRNKKSTATKPASKARKKGAGKVAHLNKGSADA